MPQTYPMNWLFIFMFLTACMLFTLSLINSTLVVIYPSAVLCPDVSHSSWSW